MSNSQVIPELTPENTAKVLKGKYDGRGKYDRSHLKGQTQSKPGPKPTFLKNLSRNSASKVLIAFDLIATLADIYREAWTRKNLALCVQMRENAADRLFGKPFTAINPAEVKTPQTVINDNRLQFAIQELIPGKAQSKKRGSKAKQVNAPPATLDAQAIDSPELAAHD
jgi:hypothetical protein